VRTFLLRAPSLSPGPRSALALQLANPLAARLRPPPPAGVSPDLYLQCVAAAYQQRQRLAAGPGGAVDNAERAVSGSATLPLRGPEPGSGSVPAAPAPPAVPAVPAAAQVAPEPQEAGSELRERAGEGARPSPVEQGGFAPPG
jgi:hypothetical protein